MEIKKVPAAHGWLWIKDGFKLILRNPILSFVLAGITATGTFLILRIPIIGMFLGMLLAPVLIAGYMRALQALEKHEEMELAHLLAGFGKLAPQLITLGGILLVGTITVSALMTTLGGEALAAVLDTVQNTSDPEVIMNTLMTADPVVRRALLIGISLLLLLSICLQFAPMLVMFEGSNAFAAIKASTIGTFRNIFSYTVYALIIQVLAFLMSALPIVLSMLLLIPIGMASLYIAYRDIFAVSKEFPREDQAHS
ncbi:MAG: BPSS1780 family membrane protein [Gallionella sp.]